MLHQMKKKKKQRGFSYCKNLANFGSIHWGSKLRIHFLIFDEYGHS